jgi:hypothetical protein
MSRKPSPPPAAPVLTPAPEPIVVLFSGPVGESENLKRINIELNRWVHMAAERLKITTPPTRPVCSNLVRHIANICDQAEVVGVRIRQELGGHGDYRQALDCFNQGFSILYLHALGVAKAENGLADFERWSVPTPPPPPQASRTKAKKQPQKKQSSMKVKKAPGKKKARKGR